MRVLSRLGLEDCFEGIICFETLNDISSKDEGNIASKQNSNAGGRIFDFDGYFSRGGNDAGLEIPKTPVVCKPFEDAYEQVFKIANINPHKTVSHELIMTLTQL